MTRQRHIIQRQILELTTENETAARQLQAEVSRLYRRRIIPLLDRCCSELSDPDRVHRIESLEIDLGTIDPRRLEEEFVAKLEAVLPRALAAQISRQEQEAVSHGPDLKARSQLELLAYFVRTGSLPWWAEAHRPGLLAECLEHLLQAAPQALRGLVGALAGEPAALRRLIHHYSDELLARLAAILLPALEPSLSGEVLALIQLLPESEAAANRPPDRLRLLAWTSLLQVAGLTGAHIQSGAQFYRAVLVRLAARLGVPDDALQTDLWRAAQPVEDPPLIRLKTTLGSLARSSSTLETALGAAARRLPSPGRAEALALLARLKAGEPDDKAVQRLFALLGDVLSPEELSDVTRLIQQAEQPTALPVAGEPALDLSFSESDALYIGNAGLVILWPFLSHFFTRLGLLEKNRFRDGAARQRAVGLLQYLASGEASFPEYLLPLNKILCGMVLDEVFEFGPPLSAAETEECAMLLAAIISQAPILRDMSVPGLRGTFLLRPGALSSRDGAWLLRVERETYDLVLDRFPWGWEWIKLPWMEAPLRVEW